MQNVNFKSQKSKCKNQKSKVTDLKDKFIHEAQEGQSRITECKMQNVKFRNARFAFFSLGGVSSLLTLGFLKEAFARSVFRRSGKPFFSVTSVTPW
jgi:hypothetical protein